jgi:class 3 adenylate cyclase
MTECTILFADIAGSTALYERLGDTRAETLISRTLEALSIIVKTHHGQVIKTIGDEIMCQFPLPGLAIQAASDMHKQLLGEVSTETSHKVSIRIGAHMGSVLQSEDDVYGDTVNVAARIAAVARPGKTMISEQTYVCLPESLQPFCRLIMKTSFKGKELPMSIYEVVWEQDDQLTRLASAPRTHSNECTLFLQYLDDRIEISQGALKIGRDPDCGLIVEAPQASRFHCEIRKKGSKFTLIDNSTNGTYILQNNVEFYFHQEEAPLHNTGTISLGQNGQSNQEHLMHFFVKSGNPHQAGQP